MFTEIELENITYDGELLKATATLAYPDDTRSIRGEIDISLPGDGKISELHLKAMKNFQRKLEQALEDLKRQISQAENP